MIVPTVGRIVHYYPPLATAETQPWPAMIAHVHNARCVNLALWDPTGHPIEKPPTSIMLRQPGDPPAPPGVGWCEWMPYQTEKAAAGNPASESAEPRPS